MLFIIAAAGLNGHTLHALDIAQALTKRGLSVRVLLDLQQFEPRLHGFDVPTSHVPNASLLSGRNSKTIAQGLVDTETKGVIVHVWNIEAALFALRLSRRLQCGMLITICEGGVPRLIGLETPNWGHIVVINERHKEAIEELQFRRRRSSGNTWQIYQRLPHPAGRELARGELLAQVEDLDAKQDGILVLRVARLDMSYLASILAGIDLTWSLREKGFNAFYLHVGRSGSSFMAEEVHGKIQQKMQEINAKASLDICVSAPSLAGIGYKLASGADVVVASDKAAMEGIMAGVPTVVVDSMVGRLQGLVREDNIDDFSLSNFAQPIGPELALRDVVEELADLLQSPSELEQYHNWAKNAGSARYSSQIGASKYLKCYQRALAQPPTRPDILRELVRRFCENFSLPLRRARVRLRSRVLSRF